MFLGFLRVFSLINPGSKRLSVPFFVVLLFVLYLHWRSLLFFLKQMRELQNVNKWVWSYPLLQGLVLLMHHCPLWHLILVLDMVGMLHNKDQQMSRMLTKSAKSIRPLGCQLVILSNVKFHFKNVSSSCLYYVSKHEQHQIPPTSEMHILSRKIQLGYICY